jgi:hypothetical protein
MFIGFLVASKQHLHLVSNVLSVYLEVLSNSSSVKNGVNVVTKRSK